ncbi:MAG: transcription termination factor Rho, partial [Fastidiosipilaceae bacterium]
EEFKGTGNMELHLDRKLAERHTFPAIDILRSGTRRDDLLIDESVQKQILLLKRMISMMASDSVNSAETTERILERMARTATNAEFLAKLGKDAA